MAEKYRLPQPNAPFVKSNGAPTVEWFNWLRAFENLFEASDSGLQAQITVIAYALGSPDGTVANIPPFNEGFLPTTTVVRGENSVVAFGTLANGLVVFTLINDIGSPGNSYYYGTDALGVKGWYLLPVPEDKTVPYRIPVGQTYTVSINKQALFTMPIDVQGSLVVDGFLVEVE